MSQPQFPHSGNDLKSRYRSFLYNFQGIAFEGRLNLTPIFFHGGGKDITGYTANKFLQGIHKCNDIIHLHDLKTLTVTSDHMCSVPCLSTNRVLLATILSGVQGGINFIVNNINVEFSFSTLKQWYSQNMPPVGETCDKACSGLRSDIASIDRCIRFDDKLLYNGYEKKMRRDAEY